MRPFLQNVIKKIIMNNELQSLISLFVFLAITISCSCLIHGYCKRYFTAAILSGFFSTVLFQAIGYLVLGYLDPFFIIALVGGWIASFVISLFVGSLFLAVRKRREK